MNILCICTWNQGRSQMAEALINHYHPEFNCTSAGTKTLSNSSAPLRICAPHVVSVLKEVGIDVSEKIPKKLTMDMVEHADTIIVLNGPDAVDPFIRNSSKTLFWTIKDPDGTDNSYHRTMRDSIASYIRSWKAIDTK